MFHITKVETLFVNIYLNKTKMRTAGVRLKSNAVNVCIVRKQVKEV